MKAPRGVSLHQVGALPYRTAHRRFGGAGVVQVLLVTSRQTGRWVVPKGNLMIGKTRHDAAAIEAEEEAGVRGRVSPVPLGHFRYEKLRVGGGSAIAEVELFPLAVTEELSTWIEMDQRERRWFAIDAAIAAVAEVELGRLIHRFGEGLGPRPVDE